MARGITMLVTLSLINRLINVFKTYGTSDILRSKPNPTKKKNHTRIQIKETNANTRSHCPSCASSGYVSVMGDIP